MLDNTATIFAQNPDSGKRYLISKLAESSISSVKVDSKTVSFILWVGEGLC